MSFRKTPKTTRKGTKQTQPSPPPKLDRKTSKTPQPDAVIFNCPKNRPLFGDQEHDKKSVGDVGLSMFASRPYSAKWSTNSSLVDKESLEGCSPRVKSLQSEMELLRNEIQRLKAIDIRTFSIHPGRNVPSPESLISSHSQKTSNRREIQTAWIAKDQISDSEVSDGDEPNVGFDRLVQKLTSRTQSSGSRNPSSNVSLDGFEADTRKIRTSGSSRALSEERLSMRKKTQTVSEGTETDAFNCSNCSELQQERKSLLSQIDRLNDKIKNQQKHAKEIEKKTKGFEREIETDRKRRSNMRHIGVMTTQISEASLKDQCCQCDFQSAKAESVDPQEWCHSDLDAENDAWLRNMESLREGRVEFGSASDQIDDLDLQWGTMDDIGDLRDRVMRILAALRLPDAKLRSLTQEMMTLLNAIQTAKQKEQCQRIEKILSAERAKMEDEMIEFKEQKQSELFHLSEEKHALSQMVVELRKLIKRETTEKETAQMTIQKLDKDLQDQFLELEQTRKIVHQKRQQINELEDTLAVLQHESENWERDYDILMRKKENLERELRLAQNLEHSLSKS